MPTSSRPFVRSALVATISLLALGSIAAGAKEQAVKIVDFGFEPKTVTVNQGEVVTWANTGTRSHTVTADDGTSFDSGALAPGDPFATLFDQAGTFTYRCTIHPDRMTGTVIVKAVAATPPNGTPEPTPPPGTLPPNFKTPFVEPSSSAAPSDAVGTPSDTAPPTPTPAGGAASYTGLVLVALLLIALAVALALVARARRRRP